MFRESRRQQSLLESTHLVPPALRDRLQRSWAQVFRERILPLLDEESFRSTFSTDGRPNKSIRLLMGAHLLKEMFDLTDGMTLEELTFNLQWHHALALEPEESLTCQKTLHNFRARLLASEEARRAFSSVTERLIQMDGLSVLRQRLDSTHILSNIAHLNRLSLFVETVRGLLKDLERVFPDRLPNIDPQLLARYLQGEYEDATREQVQRRLPVVAQDLARLVRRLAEDPGVRELESYALAARLVLEQCQVQEVESQVEVTLRDVKDLAGSTLQSPHDPDASYGHKGQGYEAQLTETCAEENPYQVITDVAVNEANLHDSQALPGVLERLAERELLPETLAADAGYCSGDNLLLAAQNAVELVSPLVPKTRKVKSEPLPEGASSEQASAKEGEPTAKDVQPFEKTDFSFNRTQDRVLRCPEGVGPYAQGPVRSQLQALFHHARCSTCPVADRCPAQKRRNGDRALRWTPRQIALENHRKRQKEPSFRLLYRKRSGIESTNAEIKHRHGAARLRVRRRERVSLVMLLKVTALNIKRAVSYHVRTLCAMLRGPATPAPAGA